ncbi:MULTISPECIES: hypothetical protein [Micromonospora]|uniref:Uncharacterized protein n=1 Tax=Micromonospora sediminimaris TaxID=547162 RepID=A0A9W5UX83_9ACTN|nr:MULTISPECIES: hypothetical protein [Micromonospora]MBQ1047490.1 hypothetical protein [Micromonospora sp. C51]GIJ36266.1 hypothetical protein Vse01_54140 [Micromonospora sediminimaris]SFD53112.1 hypothetical protein SAMN05216284_118106 [Micromonospora sediminimaris]
MAEVLPFLAAVVMFLASPVLVKRAKRQVTAWIAEARPYADVPPDQIPDYLAPEQIDAYLEYAADVVQTIPAITLTAVGVVLALPDSLSPPAVAAIVLTVVMVVLLVDSAVLGMAPHTYLRSKLLRLSPIALVGIAVNLVGTMVVAIS